MTTEAKGKLLSRINEENSMCKDLTLEFIPLITEVITSWLKEGAD
tara:strand:- start:454 stop:588 length:135 start_codon:yes stop_codon:yes gene_type:complete